MKQAAKSVRMAALALALPVLAHAADTQPWSQAKALSGASRGVVPANALLLPVSDPAAAP